MKKFLKFVMGLALFTLIIAGSGMCQSCHRHGIPIDDEEFKEKLDQYLPEAIQNVYAFDDVTDVLLYKQERSNQAFVDSVFGELSDQEVANVVSVLKKQKDGKIRVSDIVYEYNANKRIYSNLPSAPSTPSTTDKEQPDPPVATEKDSAKFVAFESLKPDK